jgi:endonuclease III
VAAAGGGEEMIRGCKLAVCAAMIGSFAAAFETAIVVRLNSEMTKMVSLANDQDKLIWEAIDKVQLWRERADNMAEANAALRDDYLVCRSMLPPEKRTLQ